MKKDSIEVKTRWLSGSRENDIVAKWQTGDGVDYHLTFTCTPTIEMTKFIQALNDEGVTVEEFMDEIKRRNPTPDFSDCMADELKELLKLKPCT